ncbi:hypothetical protein SKAU_G00342470 [Synaphobranchus kaupii]|uniref:Uncharacterized protein n=1 Tax=Synaphobranchus kaupii TaxID=118154 RepID=A0A9Q1IJJ9_SYNKA|nr:hypothetical protein SKAU_G00342470 [Synaphobranchus kaupii]
MSTAKKHKAMGDGEWMARLKKFATTGVWPSEAGNRPAPRQKRSPRSWPGMPTVPALWLTSISNEVGQILISVLTAQEGPGLDQMVSDLIARYTQAGVAPPQLLYVDCGCCVEAGGESKLKTRFSGWPDLVVRLDIYHFLRRLAGGCTTDAHHLYPTFMASLSVCIFEWDPADVALLRMAKREQLRQEGVSAITDYLVDR